MKILRAIFLTGLVVLTGCANVSVQRPGDAVVLFDGSNFSHWIGEDGNSVK